MFVEHSRSATSRSARAQPPAVVPRPPRNHADLVEYLQRTAGNRAVTRLVQRDVASSRILPTAAEDAKGIVDAHLETWYNNVRQGVEKANLSGPDEAVQWFLVALAGNLVWAATAFLDPAAAILIRVMSVAGAAVGSGTLQQLAAEDKPIAEFKQMVVDNVSARCKKMQEDEDLTKRVNREFHKQGLTDRGSVHQAHQRRQVAWEVMFKDTVPFMDRAAIEAQTKQNVEAIWSAFLAQYNGLFTIFSPDYMRRDRARYIVGTFYRALVVSGVAAQLSDVKTEAAYENGLPAGTKYVFPGGIAVRTSRDMWWSPVKPEIETIPK
jgi:hypothetical protein